MTVEVTLHLPESLIEHAKRFSQVTQRKKLCWPMRLK
jgi:hypothetical protein